VHRFIESPASGGPKTSMTPCDKLFSSTLELNWHCYAYTGGPPMPTCCDKCNCLSNFVVGCRDYEGVLLYVYFIFLKRVLLFCL